MHLPRWQRMCHGYFTADITYVLFIRQYPQPGSTDAERTGQEAYLAGNYFLNWGSWIVASLLGVGLANLIPPEWGLGFAGILCLLGIQCSLASSRMRILWPQWPHTTCRSNSTSWWPLRWP
jgi:predicted branched-subunit amino acid permease